MKSLLEVPLDISLNIFQTVLAATEESLGAVLQFSYVQSKMTSNLKF